MSINSLDTECKLAILCQASTTDVTRKGLKGEDVESVHLSPTEILQCRQILGKSEEFISKQGSEADGLRGKIKKREKELVAPKKRSSSTVELIKQTEELIKQTAELTKQTVELAKRNVKLTKQTVELAKQIEELTKRMDKCDALVKAFDLIKLFRQYDLKHVDWNTVTDEFVSTVKEPYDDGDIDTNEFKRRKHIFDSKYGYCTAATGPPLSELIAITQERHQDEDYCYLMTIGDQRRFIDECDEFFSNSMAPQYISETCLSLLCRMKELKNSNALVRQCM